MFWRLVLVTAEVLIITIWDYKMSGTYYSLDVLYCLPIIQASHIGAILSMRHSDTQLAALVGVITAVAWSIAEAAVVWPNYPLGALTVNIITRSITFTILGRVLARLWKSRAYSHKDALTGLANRLEFTEKFSTEQLRSERSSKPYSLLFIHIEQFKTLNDTHGRSVTDAALKAVSGIFSRNSRGIDTVARIGKEEFAILFPDTDEYICGVLALRINSAAEKMFHAEGWPITLSIGHVTVIGSEKNFDEVLEEADEKMNLIKQQNYELWGQV
jgi:diguanylate cyclase (GGDEF)-like protein